ncbi:MAG: helix-turn-helix domain-containing protein [Erysipelotrichaceae bacterium]|nr:helix-turn-helix domain-containing protein [Erysipelotrichaceae bacterium]
MNSSFALKTSLTGKEISAFRKRNGLSRKELAAFLNVSIRTVEKWENAAEEISGPIVALLSALDERPELLDYYRIGEKKYPLRMYYMSEKGVSTIIDVDMLNRKAAFRNYTGNLIRRAFGVKEEVTYEDFEHFLRSRCFPETRDKLKIELERLGIDSYDPLAIIRKTQGRMADDDFYIIIEQ